MAHQKTTRKRSQVTKPKQGTKSKQVTEPIEEKVQDIETIEATQDSEKTETATIPETEFHDSFVYRVRVKYRNHMFLTSEYESWHGRCVRLLKRPSVPTNVIAWMGWGFVVVDADTLVGTGMAFHKEELELYDPEADEMTAMTDTDTNSETERDG